VLILAARDAGNEELLHPLSGLVAGGLLTAQAPPDARFFNALSNCINRAITHGAITNYQRFVMRIPTRRLESSRHWAPL
jgi:hypothetical protein